MIAFDYNHWQPIAYHFIYFTSKHIISTLTQHICRIWNCSANSFRVDLTSTSFHGHRLPVFRAAKRHPQTSWRLWELSCCVQKEKKQLVVLDFWAGTSCMFFHNSFPGSTWIAWLGLWIFKIPVLLVMFAWEWFKMFAGWVSSQASQGERNHAFLSRYLETSSKKANCRTLPQKASGAPRRQLGVCSTNLEPVAPNDLYETSGERSGFRLIREVNVAMKEGDNMWFKNTIIQNTAQENRSCWMKGLKVKRPAFPNFAVGGCLRMRCWKDFVLGV